MQLGELANERIVGFSRDAELRSTVDRELAAVRRLRTPDVVVDRYRTALSLVADGIGVMVVPAIVGARSPDDVSIVAIAEPEMRRTMGVLRRHDVEVPGSSERLVDALVDAVSAVPDVDRVWRQAG